MSCENCLNMKIKCLNYKELRRKWDEIYAPAAITEGYGTRMLREAMRRGIPFEDTKLKYVYCTRGILSRFYIIRGRRTIKPKAGLQYCQFYT